MHQLILSLSYPLSFLIHICLIHLFWCCSVEPCGKGGTPSIMLFFIGIEVSFVDQYFSISMPSDHLLICFFILHWFHWSQSHVSFFSYIYQSYNLLCTCFYLLYSCIIDLKPLKTLRWQFELKMEPWSCIFGPSS